MNQTFTNARCLADTLVKTGGGKLHTLSFSCNDAAPTAGTIDVYDNTSATGTKLYSETFTTTVFRGFTILLDCKFDNGLYVDFTTTADVNCIVTYS